MNLRVVVVSEDSGGDAVGTLERLVKYALQATWPGMDTRRIEFVPLSEFARKALCGDQWRARKPGRDLILARRELRDVLLGEADVVVFHADADTVWNERHRCPRAADFRRHIVAPLVQVVPEVEERIVLWLPTWEIEAWTYQNTAVAAAIVERRELASPAAATLELWRSQRTALDDLPKPASAVALHKQFNRELTESGWPWREVYSAQRSFAAAADALSRLPRVRTSLARPDDG